MMEDLGLGLLPRDARPRDPRRRRGARRRAVGRDAADRLPALRRHAEGRRVGAEGRPRAGPVAAARRHDRDQPAHAGAACRRTTATTSTSGSSLYKRLASVESIDELDLLREELVDRFGPTPEPAQALIACHRLRLVAKPLGVTQGRRRTGAHDAAVRQGPAVRRGQADPARAEGRPHPLRRARTAFASSARRRRSPSASRWFAIFSPGSSEPSDRSS